MEKKRPDLKVLRICAGVLFLLLPAAVLWRCAGGPEFIAKLNWTEVVDILLRGGAFLTLAVGCFWGKELVMAIGTGLWCASAAVDMAMPFLFGYLGSWGLVFNAVIALVELLAVVLLLFLVVIRLVPRLGRVGKWLWVLPALLLLAGVALPFLYDVFAYHALLGGYDELLPTLLSMTLLLNTPETLLAFTAGLLLGLWCAFAPAREGRKKEAAPPAEGEPLPASPVQDLSQLGQQAELLKRYKELLDSGAVSQEEYDRKKRQILGG